ncbi:Fungal specific transcription factor [Pleurostoma richardsiae]|uniref:Fungal specific transcription factor n=1 Tax=Pleurostoma richardsiae TaxID=41990 RepID=A0AA38S8I8_9PEZI|nr:Fungal specific transcription factor [Pleurostoma richardsiae]
MLDAPLFPPPLQGSETGGLPETLEYVLPPRKQADHLVETYWSSMDPLFMFLDKPRFEHAYRGIFAGTPIDVDERIFVSTLNIIFALSAQVSESTAAEKREQLSSTYFHRAQELLHLTFWDTGSIELVHCLLLMGQYLQCTSRPQQTWMVVGFAVRIAQGLGLHRCEASTSASNIRDRQLIRRTWKACIIMDWTVAVTHGRPAIISPSVASLAVRPGDPIELGEGNVGDENAERSSEYFAKALEIYEITYSIMLGFYFPAPMGRKPAERADLVHATQREENLSNAIQFDGSLTRWERSLPSHLSLDRSGAFAGEVFHKQAVILRLRLFHARILLFRPLLVRFCVDQPGGTDRSEEGSLGDAVLESCAAICVRTARGMIALLLQYHSQNSGIGVLPLWWYRVFYIYTAATILAAATLRPAQFPRSEISESWNQALLLLRAHEGLSDAVRVFTTALQTLFSKVQETQNGSAYGWDGAGGLPDALDAAHGVADGIYPDAGFDIDSIIFGADDVAWLSSWQSLNNE